MSPDNDGRRAAVPIAAVLAAVSALLLVAVVVLAVLAFRPHGWHHEAGVARQDARDAAAGQAALDAARADLIDITTYSYKDVDQDFGWLSDFSDPKTAKPFAANQKALAKVVKGSRTVAQGQVVDAMSRVVDSGQVEIMAFVDQVLKSNTGKGYSLEQQRVSMTMTLVDGAWKIQRLDLLGSNTAS